MKRKIQAGARFFQTQAVFEISKLEPFARMARDMNVPLLMGVLVLRTPDVTRFATEHISGVHVPEKLIAELTSSKDPLQTGIEIAVASTIASWASFVVVWTTLLGPSVVRLIQVLLG